MVTYKDSSVHVFFIKKDALCITGYNNKIKVEIDIVRCGSGDIDE